MHLAAVWGKGTCAHVCEPAMETLGTLVTHQSRKGFILAPHIVGLAPGRAARLVHSQTRRSWSWHWVWETGKADTGTGREEKEWEKQGFGWDGLTVTTSPPIPHSGE